jgi:hypothetical protein
MGGKAISDPLHIFQQDLRGCRRGCLSLRPLSLKRTGLATVRTLCAVSALLSCGDLHGGTPGVSDAQIGNPAAGQSWIKELEDHGLTPSLEWDADVFINARGGRSEGAVTDGLVKLGLDLDGQQLTGLGLLANTDMHVEGYYPYGTNISEYVGDLAGVNGNAAYNSPRLYELWFQKSFQVGPVVTSFRIGLMGADQEFDVNSTADGFINTSFGAPLALGGNAPVPVYPFTALGVRLELSVGDDKDLKLTLRSAVFDGNSAAPTVITQSPLLKAASSRRNAWSEGSCTRPSCEPGGFWSGSRPSRTSKVRRCAISFANRSPFSHAVPTRGSGSLNQVRAASRNSSADEVPPLVPCL